jgi:hypothetical protein
LVAAPVTHKWATTAKWPTWPSQVTSTGPKHSRVGRGPKSLCAICFPTRVNQHPPMHQLVILFIGWVAFFHPAPDIMLINIVPQSTLFFKKVVDL